MKRLLTYIYLAMASIIVFADSPRAFLKVEYERMAKTLNTKIGDTITNIGKYMLKIGHGHSFYFDPQTNRIDSLENDPQGKIILHDVTGLLIYVH